MKNIDNAATNKISPFKKLTTEQEQLVNDIISFTKHHLTQNHPAIYTVYGILLCPRFFLNVNE